MRLRIPPRVATLLPLFPPERHTHETLNQPQARQIGVKPVEEETRRRVEKMEKLLKRYAPEPGAIARLYRETSAKR